MGHFETAITIKAAIDNIHNRQYLLPSIQRKFVWENSKIEALFDSILRGFPINSFMFWQISDNNLKSQYKFYEFLTSYRERYSEDNPYIETKAVNDFYAIIDGQQRLTSLYIGLRGSYAYKTKNKKWANSEDNIPTRHLYLNIGKPLEKEVENQNVYDFKFLTDKEYQNRQNSKDGSYWFKAGNILDFSQLGDITNYLITNNLLSNTYAMQTLTLFFQKINFEPLINYYLHDDQDPDKVLEVFLRTNSGGEPLKFSDLLMSMTTANWSIDARQELKYIIDQVAKFGAPSFAISQDFILKTCLYLLSPNIKFKVKNFRIDTIKTFENNWEKIKRSIIAAFNFLEKVGFNDNNFRAKNAAIPLIYYIYHKDLSEVIIKSTYDKENTKSITRWIILSFLKSIFGGQADGILEKIRKVLKDNISKPNFPTDEIIKDFSSYSLKDYSVSEEVLDDLLTAQKDSSNAFYILHLLYPNLDYFSYVRSIHQDHLHPKVIFENTSDDELISYGIPKDDIVFARATWNTVANLQLLEGGTNSSKNDKSLFDWVNEKHIEKSKLLVNEQTSLELKDYRLFIEDRRIVMKNLLKQIVKHD